MSIIQSPKQESMAEWAVWQRRLVTFFMSWAQPGYLALLLCFLQVWHRLKGEQINNLPNANFHIFCVTFRRCGKEGTVSPSPWQPRALTSYNPAAWGRRASSSAGSSGETADPRPPFIAKWTSDGWGGNKELQSCDQTRVSLESHPQHFQADHLEAAPLEPLYDLADEAPLNPVWLHDNQGPLPLACNTCGHAYRCVSV